MPAFSFIITIAMLSAFGLIASDIYLPAMPAMVHDLNVAPSHISQTVSVYLAALAIAQLFCGPLSDRLGRKPVLFVGIVLYIAGSLGCATTNDYGMFLLFRVFEALGAAAGLVIGRALIADTCDKHTSAKVYSVVYPLVSLSPALGPVIGGHLAVLFGWHADFIFVALFGLLTLLLVFFLTETRPRSMRAATSPFAGFHQIFADVSFWRYTLIVCCIYSAWFIYLTQSPFLFAQMGVTEEARGWLYLPLTAGIIGANLLTKRLLNIWHYDNIVRTGIYCFLLGGVAYAVVLISGSQSVSGILVPMCLVSLANGSSLSLAVSGAVSGEHGHTATASGLVGFMQIGSAALCATIVSTGLGINQLNLGGSILVLAMFALIVSSLGRRN
ncbi:Bcr/CflA family drug resistance efflux transporter [Pantoea sp. ICBG 828]|uniref:multidrug effflux MFS transporter n=1 Tax=unclassified Pantoea TaxID=2630326 RepID=UPI000CE46CF5|nr:MULTISPECIES: multidrug effflux MFS transporter [unclassified Pantoea]NIG36102.1 multidrug effflux MFS transporter [Pantoea sp. Ap-959]PPC65578.1 Bcr/CflA family drug resistance efflux transporter [Pantoea sp. ICBG 828]